MLEVCEDALAPLWRDVDGHTRSYRRGDLQPRSEAQLVGLVADDSRNRSTHVPDILCVQLRQREDARASRQVFGLLRLRR